MRVGRHQGFNLPHEPFQAYFRLLVLLQNVDEGLVDPRRVLLEVSTAYLDLVYQAHRLRVADLTFKLSLTFPIWNFLGRKELTDWTSLGKLSRMLSSWLMVSL